MWSLRADVAHARQRGTSAPYETMDYARVARGRTRRRHTARNRSGTHEMVSRDTEPCMWVRTVRAYRPAARSINGH
ncbi:hypothetical protein BHE74_00036192 [Ensete ventricosum]|nr:hypothetical protein GW17_00003038 [Ensete ventricosum]RWW57042.1 hypothetical protein BHE74_00036192 [Ensete ventricosum]